MKNVVTFRVWSQEWVDMTKEEQEYEKQMNDPKDLELKKYCTSFAFEFDFDVLERSINRNDIFEFPGGVLEDLTKVVFKGTDTSFPVMISNSLLASDFSATKSGAKEYCYFYIKSDAEYYRMTEAVWLDKTAVEKLERSQPK